MVWTDRTTGNEHSYPDNEKGYVNAIADIQSAMREDHDVDPEALRILEHGKNYGYRLN